MKTKEKKGKKQNVKVGAARSASITFHIRSKVYFASNDKAAACKATQPTSEPLTASPYTTQRGGRGF